MFSISHCYKIAFKSKGWVVAYFFREACRTIFNPLNSVEIARNSRALRWDGGKWRGGKEGGSRRKRRQVSGPCSCQKASVEISLKSASFYYEELFLPLVFSPPSPHPLCIFHFTCLNKKVDVNVYSIDTIARHRGPYE